MGRSLVAQLYCWNHFRGGSSKPAKQAIQPMLRHKDFYGVLGEMLPNLPPATHGFDAVYSQGPPILQTEKQKEVRSHGMSRKSSKDFKHAWPSDLFGPSKKGLLIYTYENVDGLYGLQAANSFHPESEVQAAMVGNQ